MSNLMNSNSMRGFRQLALANWKELARDPKTILYIMLPPIMVFSFFWFFSSLTDVSRTVTVVVPAAAEPAVHSTVSILKTMPKIRIELVDEVEGQRLQETGGYDALVTMPTSLENGRISVVAAEDSKVPVWLIHSLLAEATRKAGSPTVEVQASGDWDIDPLRFGVPGALVYAMSSLALFGIAVPMVTMRQRGVLRLLGATPVTRLTFVLAQVPVRLGMAVIMMAIAFVGLNLQEPVSVLSMVQAVATSLLGFMMLASVGYLVGGTFTSSEAATNLLAFLLPVSLMASGVLIPLNLLPRWVEKASLAIPLTYLGDALRQELVGAKPMVPLWLDHLVMFGVTVLFTYWAVRSFKWDQNSGTEHRPKRVAHSASQLSK